jgi:DNA-binding NarL/FixJ family response regulator
MKILLVDDNDLVRRSLWRAIELRGTFEVVGEARDGAEAIELVDRLQPDVVIMDIKMPVLDGIEATRVITQQHPDLKVVAFTSAIDSASMAAMLDAGASGYFLKGDHPDRLLESLANGD